MRLLMSCLVVAAFVLVAVPAPARAHTDLLSSSPAAGAVVAVPTDRMVLVFGDRVLPIGSDVVVRGPDGDDVAFGDPDSRGQTVEVRLEPLAPGRHRVAYRVVGSDGHAIAGTYAFTVAAAGSSDPHAAADPLGAEAASPAARAAQVLTESAPEAAAGPGWQLPASGLVALLLVALHALSRRRHAVAQVHAED